ncbi:hypothetical protein PR048_009700 [Dryococelus australis]|uniref:Integrase zinc-binding domain-containing protein n=1 Tax=Dryococelus australis TaxID=614101 RepID=A0ABQ9I0P4_9NEOP|nr:hypothetical protein PR048_009700 [Dryococelus australis]
MKDHTYSFPDSYVQTYLGHMGIVKCRRQAQDSALWPNITTEIKRVVEDCQQCLEQRTQLQSHCNLSHYQADHADQCALSCGTRLLLQISGSDKIRSPFIRGSDFESEEHLCSSQNTRNHLHRRGYPVHCRRIPTVRKDIRVHACMLLQVPNSHNLTVKQKVQ